MSNQSFSSTRPSPPPLTPPPYLNVPKQDSQKNIHLAHFQHATQPPNGPPVVTLGHDVNSGQFVAMHRDEVLLPEGVQTIQKNFVATRHINVHKNFDEKFVVILECNEIVLQTSPPSSNKEKK